MKHPILAIGAGLLSGGSFLVAFSGASILVTFLTLLLSLPLFLAGLGLGNRGVSLAVLSGLILTSLVNVNIGVSFVLLFGLPSWLAVRLLLTGFTKGPVIENEENDPLKRDIGWFPAGYVAAVVAAISGVYLCVVAVLAASSGGLEQVVAMQLSLVAETITQANDQEVLSQAILQLVPLFPGGVAAFWALSTLANAILAQGILAKGGVNLRPTPRLGELVLPDVLSWALVLSALIALIAPGELEYMGRNLTLVLAVPFFFLGLAVIHKAASLMPLPGALLGIIYVVLIFTGWFALMIAALGVLEQWVGLKARMQPPKNGLEN